MSFRGKLEQIGILTRGNTVSIPAFSANIGGGKTFYLDAGNGTATGGGIAPGSAISTLSGAFALLTSGKNDQIRLIASTSAVNLGATLDWSANLSHLIGEGSFGRMNQRTRLGHSANFSPILTISGYGNSFQNLYFAHGRGSATNLNLLNITGARNSFINCHFGGPFHATEAGTAGYRLIKLANSETFFSGCVFGGDTVPLTAALSLVEFGAQADPPRAIFEDCTFITRITAAGGAGATFLKVLAGCGEGLAEFRRCTFINIGGTAMTLGIDGAGLNNFRIHCSGGTTFIGCTDVVAAAQETYVSFDAAGYTAAATGNGLGVLVDHTA